MALYVTREGPQAAVNAFANLTTFGGQTLGAVTVPEGYNSIKELWVTAFPDGAANDTLGCCFLVRLTGAAIVNGPVDIVVGGWGNEQTGNSGIAVGVHAQVFKDLAIRIKPNSTYNIQFGQFGGSTTVGTPECAVTCVLAPDRAPDAYYVVRNMSDAGTANTKFALTYSADDTAAGPIKVPPGCSRISKVFAASGGITLATAIGATTCVLLEGNGLLEGTLRLPVSGHACLSTTTGVSDSFMQATVIPTDVSLKAGGELFAYAEHSTDYGTPYTAVSFEFRG